MAEIFEHGYAIVVGVDENNISRLALPTVAKDVQAVHDVLVHPQRCAYKPEHVKLLKGAESTNKNILDALYWLQEKVAGDGEATAVIYYSGHGWVDKKTEQYYLIPYDIRDLKRVRADALKADTLTTEIGSIDAKRLLVILDCCHADGMGIKSVDTNETGQPAPFPLDLPETKNIPELHIEPGAKAINDLMVGEGRAILNSSTGAQPSFVRKDRKMSLFTYHLIEALTGHAPHADDATVVYVTDVMSWVTHEVKKSAQNDGVVQTPVMRTSGVFPVAQLIGGQGVAKGIGEIPPDPLAPLPSVSVQIDHAESLVNTGTVTVGGSLAGRDMIDNSVHTGGGDYVGGDKVGGDKVGGDKISVGNISGGSGIAIGRGASAAVTITGDRYAGDFRGAILAIKATLHEVQQTIDALSNAHEPEKQALTNLISQLEAVIEKVPEASDEDAEAVAQTTEMLVNLAAVEKPNRSMLKITGEGLKRAAQNLTAVAPDVLKIAAGIITAVNQIAGRG